MEKIIFEFSTTDFIGGLISIFIAIMLFVWWCGTKVGKIDTSISWIKDELGKIWARFEKVEGAGSPLNPTQKGKKWLDDSGLSNIIDNSKKEWLLNELKKQLPKNYTDYDVQITARRLMVSLRDDEAIKPIKEYAFDNGIDIEIILRLSGLLLRDNFLNVPHKVSGQTL